MNGFNRVFIMGRLGAEPELQSSKNGKPYVKLSIATHYRKKLETGEKQDTTTWHRVTVWGKSAERCQNYLHKGSSLAIEGYLSKYSYAREDGSDAHSMSIVAREVHFIGGRQDRGPGALPADAPEGGSDGPDAFVSPS